MSVLPTPIPPASGPFLAELLGGCWRKNPPTAPLDAAQFEAHLQALAGSGAGALAWRRVRHSPLATSNAALALQKIHFKQALDTKIQERQIAQAFETLRAAGVEPILTKGWATARYYPEPGLRPSGDIDLLIRPADIAATERVLGVEVNSEMGLEWDVKSEVPALYKTSRDAIFQNQERVMIGATEVAVLGAEEHLRIHCLHFLKHGGWRPLWLCDIAAALESRPATFDWKRCLSDDARSADGVACALGLAHRLLGANVEDTPIARRAARLPGWMVPAILKQWQTPQVRQHMANPLLSNSLRSRESVVQAIAKRWPDPIYATMQWQTPLDWPPLLAQTASFLGGGLFFVKRAAGLTESPNASLETRRPQGDSPEKALPKFP